MSYQNYTLNAQSEFEIKTSSIINRSTNETVFGHKVFQNSPRKFTKLQLSCFTKHLQIFPTRRQLPARQLRKSDRQPIRQETVVACGPPARCLTPYSRVYGMIVMRLHLDHPRTHYHEVMQLVRHGACLTPRERTIH